MLQRIAAGLMFLAGVVLLSGTARAQDGMTPPEEEGLESGLETEIPPTEERDLSGLETDIPMEEDEEDAAIRRVPTYDLAPPETVALDETPQESYLRLAQDFIFISEIGAGSVGQVPIWPRGNLRLGPLLLFPYLQGRISYTSNVFENEAERSSWFITEGGGIAGEVEFAGGRGDFRFGADYQHHDYLNRDLSYSEWTAGAGVGYRFTKWFWAEAGVKWDHLVDPVAIEFRGKMKRDQIYPYVTLGLDQAFGNDINIEVGLRYLNASFDDRDFDTAEREEWNAYTKVSVPFMKDQSRVYVRYDYFWDDRDSERQNNLDQGHQISGGIEGSIPLTRTERLTGFVSVGYRRDLYDDPSFYRDGTDRIQTDNDEKRGDFFVAAAVRWLMNPRTSADFRVLRTLQFSASSNYQELSRLEATLTHNMFDRVVTRLGAFFEHSEPSTGASITRFGVGTGARYLLLDNVDLDVSLDWRNRNTNRQGFDTTTFIGSFGVTLYFR